MNLSALYRTTRTRLAEAGIETAALDARLLVEHFAGVSANDIVCRPMADIPENAAQAVEAALARRLAGEPVHRILGYREFYGLRLRLSAETLEPRPDTETLVDAMLPFVRDRAAQSSSCRILDLGTGTGAIALALLDKVAQASAVGVDISQDALATATANAADLGLGERFMALRSDWFEKISGRFDAIVSNPPYIRSDEIDRLDVEVRSHDPMAALDGGPDGLEAYRRIAAEAGAWLAADGRIGLEIGYDQRDAVCELFEAAGFELVEARQDLAANDRVLVFKPAK
jgi:release factor glutamine methyltransferase